jgi:hypothetical protein
MVLTSGLPIIAETAKQKLPNEERLHKIIQSCDESNAKITAVFRVLYQITEVQSTTYLDDTQMIDLEGALKKEMLNYYQQRKARNAKK